MSTAVATTRHPKTFGYPSVYAALRRLDPFQKPWYWHWNRDLDRLGGPEACKRAYEFDRAEAGHPGAAESPEGGRQ